MFTSRTTSVLLLGLCAGFVHAQAIPIQTTVSTTGATAASDAGPAGIIPAVVGPNVSIGTTSQHDSSNGWSSLLTPDFAWRLNRHFSADVSAPIYDYINVLVTGGTKAKPTYTQQTRKFVAGDTSMNAHYEVDLGLLSYEGTATLGLPSGSKSDGLGAGQVTYNFNNHFEKDFDLISPEIEIGIGDSSSLNNARVRKSYTSVGTLAFFEAGVSVDLTHHINFETDAYEDLPIGSQTLLSTTGKGKKKVTTVTNNGITEDNGFTNSLDIPIFSHVTLSGFYNRSLRSHIDTAGFSLVFLLRPPPREPTH